MVDARTARIRFIDAEDVLARLVSNITVKVGTIPPCQQATAPALWLYQPGGREACVRCMMRTNHTVKMRLGLPFHSSGLQHLLAGDVWRAFSTIALKDQCQMPLIPTEPASNF